MRLVFVCNSVTCFVFVLLRNAFFLLEYFMKLRPLFVPVFALLSLLFVSCVDDDYTCDEATFVPSCLDQTTVKICTHGEIAHWECSANQVCKTNTCEDP